MWLIVGMAEPIAEDARRINVCADGLADKELLAKSALAQTRQRLGKAAPEWLFKQCRRTSGGWNDTLMVYGKVYKFLPSMVFFFEQRRLLNSENTLAQVIPLTIGGLRIQY